MRTVLEISCRISEVDPSLVAHLTHIEGLTTLLVGFMDSMRLFAKASVDNKRMNICIIGNVSSFHYALTLQYYSPGCIVLAFNAHVLCHQRFFLGGRDEEGQVVGRCIGC